MFSAKYFKDKVILLMGLILGLLALLSVLQILIQTNTSQSSTILRYWTVQGAPEFDKQSPEQLFGFALLSILSLIIGVVISYKLYDTYKPASYVMLLLSHLVIFTNIVVSYAILNLQQ